MASFTQRAARAAELSGIDDDPTETLLKKPQLTERDRLHMLRVFVAHGLQHVRDDLEAWAHLDPSPDDDPTRPRRTKDDLLQLESDLLAAQANLDTELGDERVLVALDTYSEPRIWE